MYMVTGVIFFYTTLYNIHVRILLSCRENKAENMETDTPPSQRAHVQQDPTNQAQDRMSIRRSAWEPAWGPVFKNKEHFVEMHLC